MLKSKSLFSRSLAVVLSLLMLITCAPLSFAPIASAASSEYQVFGYVTLGPIIYTHGTCSYSHADWTNNGQLDYMMDGTRVADASYDGEASTALSVSIAKGLKTIEAYDASLNKISTANLSMSNGLLRGDFGSGFNYPRGNASTTVILKFTFTDNTYEYHQRTVYSNPVAKSTVSAILGRAESIQNRRGEAFEVLAKGSYGNASESIAPGGNASYGGLFWDSNTFGNEKHSETKVNNGNYVPMYAPYSTTFDVWGTGLGVAGQNNHIFIDSLTDEPLYVNKTPGFYGAFAYRRNGARDCVVKTSHPAVYYLDISRNDNYGITNTAAAYSVDLFVGNLYFNGRSDFDDYSRDGANVMVSSQATKGVTFDTSGAKTKLDKNSATYYDLYLNGTAVAGETIKATVYVKHIVVNEHDEDYPVLAGIYTDVEIHVTDKSSPRSVVNEFNTTLNNLREQCYTPATWAALRTALLNLEQFSEDNTDTNMTKVEGLVNAVRTAYSNLELSENEADHATSLANTVRATCTDPSTETYQCRYCQFSYETHNDAATGHNYSSTTYEPSCTEQGYDLHRCSKCGDTYKDNYVDALDHKNADGSSAWRIIGQSFPTCTATGRTDYKCDICGATKKEYADALGHDWDEGEVTTAATCTTAGVKTFTCKNDPAHTKTERIPATGHTEVIDAAVEATCMNSGLTEGKHCSVCGTVLVAQKKTYATHKYSNYTSNDDATCTADGTKWAECDFGCGTRITVTDVGSKLPHTAGEPVYENEVAGDCRNEGTKDKVVYCAICETEMSRETVSNGELGDHNWTYNYGDATCTTAATVTKTCSICGEEVVEEGVKKPHVYRVEEEAVEATCTTPGKTAVEKCVVCGDVKASTDVEALGHDLDHVHAVAAKCETDGNIEYWACSRCGKNFTDAAGTTEAEDVVVEATGHTESINIPEEPATCEDEGMSAEIFCSVCGMQLQEREVIPALGHSYGAWTDNGDGTHSRVCANDANHKETADHTASGEGTVETAATCTDAGVMEYTCADCGATYDAEIPATGHKYKKVDGKDPTCTEDGFTGKTLCWNEGCEYYYGNDTLHYFQDDLSEEEQAEFIIPKLGHIETEVVITPATCTADGEAKKVCSRCGEQIGENYTLPMVDHSFKELVSEKVEPTCGEAGREALYKCEWCDTVDTAEGRNGAEISALGHNWVQKVVSYPTCTEDGKYTSVCARCGETNPEYIEGSDSYDASKAVIPHTEHTWQKAVRDDATYVAPTCTEAGGYYMKSSCARCGLEQDESEWTWVEVPATGHVDGEPVMENVVEATCTEGGKYDEVVYCLVCHPAKVDDEGNVIKDDDGNIVYDTDKFTEISRETITTDALGHDWNEGVVTTPATCTVDGVKTYTCKREGCGETKTEVITAPGHTPGEAVIENEVAANCGTETDGSYDKVFYCTVCTDAEGKATEISRETITVPYEHTPGEAVIENRNFTSCEEGGSYDEVVYCTVCNSEISRETKTIEPGDHVRGRTEYEDGDAPTCTEDGTRIRVTYCKICDAEIQRKVLKGESKLGHDFDVNGDGTVDAQDGSTTIPATCTEPERTVVKCIRCDETKTIATSGTALGHTPGEEVEENVVPATCKHDGSKQIVVYCTVCEAEISRKTVRIPSPGHHDDNNDGYCDDCGENFCEHDETELVGVVEMSCNPMTDGYTGDEVCSICGKVIEKGYIIPAAHNIVIDEAVAPTCYATGLTAGTHCDVCGSVIDAQRPVDKIEHKQITIPGVAATCSTPGTSDAVVCEVCGLVITEHRIINETTKHVDNDGDGNCDTCGKSMVDNCECLCHKKSWISKAFYKFVLFFWKLFHISKTCDCGAVHY